MDAITLLKDAEAAGLKVKGDGDKLVISGPKKAEAIALKLLEHKDEVLSHLELRSPSRIAEDIAACLRLGRLLQRGDIPYVMCGIKGQPCRLCAGVPCIGSRVPGHDE